MIEKQNVMLRTNIIGQVIDITPNTSQRRGYRINIKDSGCDLDTLENRLGFPLDHHVKDLVGETIYVDPKHALSHGPIGQIVVVDPEKLFEQGFMKQKTLLNSNINDFVSLKINLPVEFTFNQHKTVF